MYRDLVERAMTGDHDAFAELARVSIGRLFVVARLILRDTAAAEDATQEALVAAWQHIRRRTRARDPGRDRALAAAPRDPGHACRARCRGTTARRGSEEAGMTSNAPRSENFDLLMTAWLESDAHVREPETLLTVVLTRTS